MNLIEFLAYSSLSQVLEMDLNNGRLTLDLLCRHLLIRLETISTSLKFTEIVADIGGVFR